MGDKWEYMRQVTMSRILTRVTAIMTEPICYALYPVSYWGANVLCSMTIRLNLISFFYIWHYAIAFWTFCCTLCLFPSYSREREKGGGERARDKEKERERRGWRYLCNHKVGIFSQSPYTFPLTYLFVSPPSPVSPSLDSFSHFLSLSLPVFVSLSSCLSVALSVSLSLLLSFSLIPHSLSFSVSLTICLSLCHSLCLFISLSLLSLCLSFSLSLTLSLFRLNRSS